MTNPPQQPAQPAFQRARSPQHKQQRHRAILDAARTLGLRDGVRAVTLTDIAAEAGVHKSAVLRYFETREEVFLQITAEGWQEWAHELRLSLPSGPVPPQVVAARVAATLVNRPLFCDLLAHAPLHLERNVSLDAVRTFKLTALAAVDEIRTVLASALPALAAQQAADLVAAVTALAAALWQTSNPPPTLARLYAQDPRLAHAAVDFPYRLRDLTEATILGLLVQPQPQPQAEPRTS
ncbi:TetR family transcriptional regulator [Streptomyces polygonati]|uniref:TetR family transcriptional regulator n=1 Tax=Streptomyces polygonati TaxID=1617087 RepID=A0ABV8HQS9_9ACTN